MSFEHGSLSLWQFIRVVSANPHCRPKFLNFSARKTCQYSWVASFAGRGGWFQISLAQSRIWVLCQAVFPIWQLPRQFAIVLRFGWKERALVERLSGCLIGQGSGLTRLVFRASGGQVRLGL